MYVTGGQLLSHFAFSVKRTTTLISFCPTALFCPKLEFRGGPVELDHWANWFFHIFMETNKTAPMYGEAPKRLASAYAGMAVSAPLSVELHLEG